MVKSALNYFQKLVYVDQKKLGEINGDRLAKLQDFYLEKGIIQKKTPVEDLYTNQFIEIAGIDLCHGRACPGHDSVRTRRKRISDDTTCQKNVTRKLSVVDLRVSRPPVPLAKHGWSVRVHERADQLRPSGAGIYIYENGLRVLETLGAYDEAVEGAAVRAYPRDARRDQQGPVGASLGPVEAGVQHQAPAGDHGAG